MIKLNIVQLWSTAEQQLELNAAFFSTLDAIQSTGSIAKAAQKLNVSYRYLWGWVARWSESLGSQLVLLERGRGARLAPFGEKLLWANKRIGARLSRTLDGIASELELELRPMVAQQDSVLRMQASHGFAVELLREALVANAVAHELKYVGSDAALDALRSGTADLAGFHLPEGELQASALAHFAPWLTVPGLVLIELAYRQQGLITATDNPKRIASVADLTNKKVRFVNRQSGAGTRLVFDLLLAQEKIDPARIVGYDTIEYTHSAIAAFVASGMADVGFGVETGARRFALNFIPVLQERYFF